MKKNFNRSVVSIPDCFGISMTDLPSWIRYFTMSNNHYYDEIQNYIVIIPNAFTNEIIGEEDAECLELYPLAIRFSGKRIYDQLVSDNNTQRGFALYAVYEKSTITGYRVVTITQDATDKTAIEIDSFSVQGKIDNVLRKIDPKSLDLIHLTRFIFPDAELSNLEEAYKYIGRYFLNFKKTRHYFHVINNRPSSKINKKALINFLGISIEFTFDLVRKKETQSYITKIHINNKNHPTATPLLSTQDVIELLDEKNFIAYMRDYLLPKS